MSSLTFVYLARDAGPAFEPLAMDIAALTHPGDHVVIVEDSGTTDTPARIGRFAEQIGWGTGVTSTAIITGTAGHGDLGVAANIALDALLVPGAARDRLVFLCAGAGIDKAAFTDARAQAEAEALDLLAFPLRQWSLDLGQLIDGPDQQIHPEIDTLSRAKTLRPGLDGMIIRSPITGPLTARCAEGQASFGALGFWWHALNTATRIGVYPHPLGHRGHPPDPDAALLHAMTALIEQDPSAALWADSAVDRLLAGLTPGAVTGLLAAGPALAQAIGPTASSPVVQAFAAGDTPGARHALRPLMSDHETGAITAEQSLLSTPTLHTTPAAPRVYITGAHQHRQPFAYAALAPLWEGQIDLTTDPKDADLISIAHPHNLGDMTEAAAGKVAQGTPTALISEEPFWDTLFSPDPLAHMVVLHAAHLGSAQVHQVNHHRSPIFDFARIPYFLLTDPGYIQRYGALFHRNAQLTAEDWAHAFANRPHDITFMAERRPEAFHDIDLPSGDITGLCAWRTRLAIGCITGRVQRLGASWGHGASRFDLSDWHSDKLAGLDGQTRILSGVENTHQPTYLSEKLFDAFACGARPIYYASPGHRVHDLAHDIGLPSEAWINLWGQNSDAAPEAIDAAPWDAAFYSAYAQAQSALAALFTDAQAVASERARLGHALIAEVRRLVDYGPA